MVLFRFFFLILILFLFLRGQEFGDEGAGLIFAWAINSNSSLLHIYNCWLFKISREGGGGNGPPMLNCSSVPNCYIFVSVF